MRSAKPLLSFVWLVLAGTILVFAGLGCGGKPSSSDAPPSAASAGAADTTKQDRECILNLRQFAIAFHINHDALLIFPSEALSHQGMNCWRVDILPYIEQVPLWNAFTREPWDGPNNKKLVESMPDIYRDPRFQKKEDKPTTTYYRAFTGEGTVFGTPKGVSLNQITNTNGLANTMLIFEAGDPVTWTKPDDLVYDPKKPLPPFGGPKRSDFYAVFCDGHVRRIPANTDEKTLRCMIQYTNTTPFVLPGKEVEPPLKLGKQ